MRPDLKVFRQLQARFEMRPLFSTARACRLLWPCRQRQAQRQAEVKVQQPAPLAAYARRMCQWGRCPQMRQVRQLWCRSARSVEQDCPKEPL
mmetsp:Transcript_23075/g.50632  ORF Transcript_23075/g.50632 Transcript_23075/m.50632 type:complete len:92 (+) Transcript_23075:340-615(+)